MNDERIHKRYVPPRMALIGIVIGLIFWAGDALVDAFLFHGDEITLNPLALSTREALFRLLIMLVVIGFSIYWGTVISRQKRSEEKLLESEQRYRALFENARDVIYTLSADGAFTSVNHAFETTTGWPFGEVLGKSFLALVHPDDAPRASTLFQSVLGGQVLDVFELRIRARSGHYLAGEITATPQMQNGRVVGVLGIARDVTKRKTMERALQESELKSRDLFENANGLIQSVGPDGTFLYVNRAWRETLGYTEEELEGLAMLDVIHPDFRTHCLDLFSRVNAGENLDHVEGVFVTKGGKSVVVEGNVNCSIVDGAPLATRGIFRNITEHRLATEFIRNILESVDEGFIVVDRDYRIISANKAYTGK